MLFPLKLKLHICSFSAFLLHQHCFSTTSIMKPLWNPFTSYTVRFSFDMSAILEMTPRKETTFSLAIAWDINKGQILSEISLEITFGECIVEEYWSLKNHLNYLTLIKDIAMSWLVWFVICWAGFYSIQYVHCEGDDWNYCWWIQKKFINWSCFEITNNKTKF